jgi:hypothetical protein
MEGKQKPFLLIYLQLSNFLYVFRQTPDAVQIPTDRAPRPLQRPAPITAAKDEVFEAGFHRACTIVKKRG